MGAYKDRLDALWAAHTAPRADDAPTVVSTFAGAGGSSLGYSAAGYRELLAVEWDRHAVDCLRRNFPHVPVHHGDIAKVDPDTLGLAPGELDLFDGSPPCQGFSTNGNRQIDDPRNHLFREYVRLLDAWQPKTFVMENVSGMIKGKMRALFAEILTTLKAAGPGYRVVARLVDCGYFGVATMRQRMIFVGVREDLGLDPVHPKPQMRPPVLRHALEDLGDPGLILRPKGRITTLAPLVRPGYDGADVLHERGAPRAWFNLQRAHWDRQCWTITKSMAPGRHGIMHPDENRFLSSREICRIQGFPDAYDWGDSRLQDIWARVGNSVPPPVSHAVAQTIRDHILTPARDGTPPPS
ncbi:DNA-cytosine methyltransferase [Streptomyces gancidicus BKS 13-15]|uniref:Cytosine-specific methyltransferase n=1 Tax=Streptomyces gancidicus BKS 13-15 TaxID=1284664 RepID=M3C8K2_STREZ|nr:DNA cytosine methyltransferase [Streptomyces gancidicus]EMF20398.1 DNA-cytosine methyltransferase [Streptomyces gancidicus BKS 13-15]